MSLPATSNASSLSLLAELHTEDPEVLNANLALISDRYKGSVASLPEEKGWLGRSLLLYQGFWYTSKTRFSVETVMALQDSFQANPTDIYLVTQPKSGTTWLLANAFAILNRTRYKTNISSYDHPLLTFSPQDIVPSIENEILQSKPSYPDVNSTRLFASHVPFTSLPQSIIDSGCHLIYLCRNPKDVFVSLFHYLNYFKEIHLEVMTIEVAFDKFSKGIGTYGPYWDHVKGYYKASVEHPTRVLFLTYENMKINTANNVKRLADFMGCPFTAEEEANGAVQDIVSLCSFESLSHVNKVGTTHAGVPKKAYFREGKVGDSSNYLTKEMRQILDDITKEKFHGLDISF